MTAFEIATLTGQYLIGFGQIAIIWYGIRRMVAANESRASQQSALMERQERQAERRHTESMTALQALIRGLETQGQALRDQGQALRDQGQALRDQGQALQTLIVRTGEMGTA